MSTKHFLPEFLMSFCQSHLVGGLLSKTQKTCQSGSIFPHCFLKVLVFQENKEITGNNMLFKQIGSNFLIKVFIPSIL